MMIGSFEGCGSEGATPTGGKWKECSKVSSLWIRRDYWSCFIKYEMRCQEAETK
jgi:hypothetical protein